MNGGAAAGRPPERADSWRPWCLAAAALVALVALVPPLFTAAREADYAAALQFALLAVVVPALVTIGAPWRSLGLSAGSSAVATAGAPGRVLDRVADRRRRHRELAALAGLHRARPGGRRGVALARSGRGGGAPRLARRARGGHPPRLRRGPLARARAVAAVGTAIRASPARRPRRHRHVGVLDPRLHRRPVQPRLLSELHPRPGGVERGRGPADRIRSVVVRRNPGVRPGHLLERGHVAQDGGRPRHRADGTDPGGAPSWHAAQRRWRRHATP